MGISKVLRIAFTKAGNRVGLYSKRQSVETATNIGKELVDISKTSTTLTQDVIQSTVKKYVPHAKVNIITNKEELGQMLLKAGQSPENLESLTNNADAFYFNLKGKAKGIFIPEIQTPRQIAIFSHELEHYMYNEHTPKRKAITASIHKILSAVEKLKKTKPLSNVEGATVGIQIQQKLFEFFGINDLALNGELKGIQATSEGVTGLLKGKNFLGLSNDKRVNAYIRTITRNQMHPKKGENLGKIFNAKTILDDEVRAYGVSDAVERYAAGTNDLTRDRLIADIYRRTSNVLKDELKVGFKHLGKNSNPKTGLPTMAFCGERYNPFDALKRSFAKCKTEQCGTITLPVYNAGLFKRRKLDKILST